MSTLTLVRVAVVRRFVEMSWSCRPWAPESVGDGWSIVVDHRRDRLVVVRCHSMPFDGPRHSRARNDIRVPYSAEESQFLNTSHNSPLGRGQRPRPGNGLFPTQLSGTESAGEKSALVSDSAPAFGPSPVPVASGQVQSRTDGMSSP